MAGRCSADAPPVPGLRGWRADVLRFDAQERPELIADALLVSRLSGRTTCDKEQKPFTGLQPGTPCPDQCGGTLIRRKDDEPEAIQNRLNVYHAQTKPVLDWYVAQGANVRHIDAVGSFDDVYARALAAVGR